MSTHAPDPELVLRVSRLTVRNVTVQVGAKRTIKVGEDFRSFDSSVTVTLHDPSGEPITMDAAQLAAILQTPNLVTKVYTDLWIAGVMTKDETIEKMREAKKIYPRLAGVKHDEGQTDGDLQGTGDDAGAVGPLVDPGDDVPAGETTGVPPVSGPPVDPYL